MHWQITQNWGRLIGWSFIFLLGGSEPVSAQFHEDIFGLIPQEESEAIHEDEIILIDDLLSRTSGIDLIAIHDFQSLSILSASDYHLIKQALNQNDESYLIEAKEMSSVLRLIINALNENEGIYPKIVMKQLSAISDDTRYRWHGKSYIKGFETGILNVRNKYEQHIANDGSVYFGSANKSSLWIIGDQSIAYGFGLNAGRPFPARRGFSTISKGATTDARMRGYNSATSTNRIRGGAYKKTINNHSILISIGEVNGRGGINHYGGMGIYMQENASNKWGMVFSEKTQSIFGGIEKGKIELSAEASHGIGTPSFVLAFQYEEKPFQYVIHFRDLRNGSLGETSSPMAAWQGRVISEKGIFQGGTFRVNHTRIMVYADWAFHVVKNINKQVLGVRTESRFGRHHIIGQLKFDQKDEDEMLIYGPRLFEDELRKESFRLEHKYASKLWRSQLKAQWVKSGVKDFTYGKGIDFRFTFYQPKYQLEMDWMIAKVDDYNSRIYFWDVNLPGEMHSRLFTKSGHGPGFKLLFLPSVDVRMGIRIKTHFTGFSFNASPIIQGGLLFQANL